MRARTGKLIGLSVAEVRRLLWKLVWAVRPAVRFVLGWSTWRRQHQAVAKVCHYKRRFKHLQL